MLGAATGAGWGTDAASAGVLGADGADKEYVLLCCARMCAIGPSASNPMAIPEATAASTRMKSLSERTPCHHLGGTSGWRVVRCPDVDYDVHIWSYASPADPEPPRCPPSRPSSGRTLSSAAGSQGRRCARSSTSLRHGS